MYDNRTIAALATAPAPAGVAVVRISGPDAPALLQLIFHAKDGPIEHPRALIYGRIYDPIGKELIDNGCAVYMPAPNSFTGEDVVEFHLHGSPLLTKRLLAVIYQHGAAPAEAGEFSRRAFLNGKMDLTQAEGLCDMINATSDAALKVAQQQFSGKMAEAVVHIGEPLRNILAELEASLDFPEEGIEWAKMKELQTTISSILERVNALSATYREGEILRQGFKVLLCGLPNAGKSSLLNQFLGRERAIVSEEPGTTRDLLEENILWQGIQFVFCDSAGLRKGRCRAEQIGVELTENQITWADLVLFLVDCTIDLSESLPFLERILPQTDKLWLVYNKIDLLNSGELQEVPFVKKSLRISAKQGEGIANLKQSVIDEAMQGQALTSESTPLVTNERHYLALLSASTALTNSIKGLTDNQPLETVSWELHSALNSLEEIIGITSSEDLLDRIFSRFCIGK